MDIRKIFKNAEFIVKTTVPITPVAWHLDFKRGQVKPYLGSTAVQYKETVRTYLRLALANAGIKPLEYNGKKNRVEYLITDPSDEILIIIEVYFNYNKKFRYQNEMGQWRKKIPDNTNIQKLVEDAMSGLIYKDDIQTRAIITYREQSNTNKLEISVFKYGREKL